MREPSKLEKTKLPGDTDETWLGTQRKRPDKASSQEAVTPDSYEIWIRRRVETNLKATRTT